MDELRLRQVWSGEALLVRPTAAGAEKRRLGLPLPGPPGVSRSKLMRDVLIASLVLSFLAMLPASAIMVVLDKVMTYRNMATLNADHRPARRWPWCGKPCSATPGGGMINMVGTRVDVRLNAMVFARVLGLPIDFFERARPARSCTGSARSGRSATS